MPTPPGLTVRDNQKKYRFEIDLGNGSFAVAEYRLYPGRIVLTHTEVPEAHQLAERLSTSVFRLA